MLTTLLSETVRERDIDFVLLEEFHSTPSFGEWFLNQMAVSELYGAEFDGARRSARQSNLGESDLEVAFQLHQKRCWVLIENKVDAAFQPNQAQRYKKRGQEYIRTNQCDVFNTVLIAPQEYLEHAREAQAFDCTVSLESVRDWFSQDQCARNQYKVRLLSEAIEQARRGYLHVRDEQVTSFWERYWRLATEIAPELDLPEPGSRAPNAGFILYHPLQLTNALRLYHKLRHGNVDLTFMGWGERHDKLQQQYGSRLDADMVIVKTGKSVAVRIKVPSLIKEEDFEKQRDRIKQGIMAARRLYRWAIENEVETLRK